MTTFCPHCREEVSPEELLDADEGWSCFNCGEVNPEDEDECSVCGLSRDASEYLDGDDE